MDSAADPWKRLAEKAVGGSLDGLTHRSPGGIVVEPLYPRHAHDVAQPWRALPAWRVDQRVDHPEPAEANRLALLDLEGGADALTLVISGAAASRGYGLQSSVAAFDTALEGVDLDFIALRIDGGAASAAAAHALAHLVADRRLTSADLGIAFGYDPIGVAARAGGTPDATDLPALLETRAATSRKARLFRADGRPYHEAGASAAQELAAVIATGVAYLRWCERAGLTLDDARSTIEMTLAADCDVFEGIAKVRALRRLWRKVEAASGLDPVPVALASETSWRMMTRFDPWTNVMRATAAAFAAGVGGADHIVVLPFTLVAGLPDAAARRLARNVGRVLIDEAHLARVDDPSAGSGGIEALTSGLCEAAWTGFQAIEREGGMEAALAGGTLRASIQRVAESRETLHAVGKAAIVGTSLFASFAEPPDALLPCERRPPDEGTGLRSRRDAEPFEAIRDEVEARAAQGSRPVVYLAALGTPARYGARAAFATTFFASAGLDAQAPPSALAPEAAAEAFAASGASVACLVGADADYATAGAYVAALRAAGARMVLLAGPRDAASAAGADDAVFAGCQALDLLRRVVA